MFHIFHVIANVFSVSPNDLGRYAGFAACPLSRPRHICVRSAAWYHRPSSTSTLLPQTDASLLGTLEQQICPGHIPCPSPQSSFGCCSSVGIGPQTRIRCKTSRNKGHPSPQTMADPFLPVLGHGFLGLSGRLSDWDTAFSRVLRQGRPCYLPHQVLGFQPP